MFWRTSFAIRRIKSIGFDRRAVIYDPADTTARWTANYHGVVDARRKAKLLCEISQEIRFPFFSLEIIGSKVGLFETPEFQYLKIQSWTVNDSWIRFILSVALSF